MKRLYLIVIVSVVVTITGFAAVRFGRIATADFMNISDVADVDSVAVDTLNRVVDIDCLPDTSYTSTSQIDYKVEIADSITSGDLLSIDDTYNGKSGAFTFRGGLSRNMTSSSVSADSLKDIVLDWTFKTEVDTTKTAYGIWHGGTGWTGQPLYIEWDSVAIKKNKNLTVKAPDIFSGREIIVGSLSGSVYFIDFESGKRTRAPFKVGNTIKGTVSLDPELNGNLYIGHGIPKQTPFGFTVMDVFSGNKKSSFGRDSKALRGWGAFDSSPVVVGGFLFWPAENGSFYKFSRENGDIKMHSALRYRVKGKPSLGIENSLAVFKNYGFFGDNNGMILCVNLNNMKPVWLYDNKDDIDASIVVDTLAGRPSLYVGCEVDKQGNTGYSYFTKLDALTGEELWSQKIACSKKHFGTKTLDGGMFATPVLGSGDCENIIFANFAVNNSSAAGEIIAFDKKSGEIIYRTATDNYLWSSPVCFCSSKGVMYLFTADTQGWVYLVEGKSGRIIVKKKIGANFESSPVVVGNSVVLGSRGREIYKMSIQ